MVDKIKKRHYGQITEKISYINAGTTGWFEETLDKEMFKFIPDMLSETLIVNKSKILFSNNTTKLYPYVRI